MISFNAKQIYDCPFLFTLLTICCHDPGKRTDKMHANENILPRIYVRHVDSFIRCVCLFIDHSKTLVVHTSASLLVPTRSTTYATLAEPVKYYMSFHVLKYL